MYKQAGVALGAGLASALLFVVSAKGSMAAALITYFTALPILIAALGFGHLSGLAGAAIGAGAIAIMLGPMLALFFALCFALPGWWLGFVALLGRRGPVQPGSGAPSTTWYPVGRIVSWAATLAVGAVLAMGGIVLLRFGGLHAATLALARRLDDTVGGDASAPVAAQLFVRMLPLAMAASLFLMFCVNLWLAGRVTRISGRLIRPWPSVPEGFTLPRSAALLFAAALVPAFLGGVAGAVGGTIAATLGVAFALQGLAAAHVLTRGFNGRRGILTLIYLVTLVVPVAIFALAILGIIDCLTSLRSRRPPSPSTPVV